MCGRSSTYSRRPTPTTNTFFVFLKNNASHDHPNNTILIDNTTPIYWWPYQVMHVRAELDVLSEADTEWLVKLHYSFQV